MNIKELMGLLKLAEDIIDEEEVRIYIDDSRDGSKSFVVATVRFTKDMDGTVILAVRYHP